MFTGQQPDHETSEGDYPTVVSQANGKKVPIVQAYAFSKYLGYLEVEFDNEGNLISFQGSPILLNGSVPQDPEALELLEKYRPGIIGTEVIGSTKVFLDGNCRRNECNLGNFYADSLIGWYSANRIPNDTEATIALFNGGDIRVSIYNESDNGQITMEDAALSIPFANNLTMLHISGKVLIKTLEHSVKRFTVVERPGEFLQMSGLRVVYDMNKPPGQRVKEVKIICTTCDTAEYHDVDESKMYNVLLSSYLASGGDGYEILKRQPAQNLYKLLSSCFIFYLKQMSPIEPKIEGRITIIQETSKSTFII